MEITEGLSDPEYLAAIKTISRMLGTSHLVTFELPPAEGDQLRRIRGFGNITVQDQLFWAHHLLLDLLNSIGYSGQAQAIEKLIDEVLADVARRSKAWLS
jgi:hypothetical protein